MREIKQLFWYSVRKQMYHVWWANRFVRSYLYLTSKEYRYLIGLARRCAIVEAQDECRVHMAYLKSVLKDFENIIAHVHLFMNEVKAKS